jgi:hypothetical protein
MHGSLARLVELACLIEWGEEFLALWGGELWGRVRKAGATGVGKIAESYRSVGA